jgi:hypothetical protein
MSEADRRKLINPKGLYSRVIIVALPECESYYEERLRGTKGSLYILKITWEEKSKALMKAGMIPLAITRVKTWSYAGSYFTGIRSATLPKQKRKHCSY